MPIIYTYPAKNTPVGSDLIVISDSEASKITKRATLSTAVTNNQIKYDLNATQDGLNVDLNLTSSDASDNSVVQFTAGSNITLTRNSATEITIAASGGGGGGTPGGSDTQIQYNDGGSFGGTTGLTWDDSTNILSIATRYEGDIDGAVLQQVLVKEPGGVTKGDVVYISGGTGDNPEVRKAQSNSISTMAALGIMKNNTSVDTIGECVTSGEITGVDLTGFTTGDELFVSNTAAGGLKNSSPSGEANLIQKIGKVIKGGTGGALTVLGAFRTNATPNLNQGSLFIGSGANESTTLAIGANNTILTSNGTTATWAANSSITSFDVEADSGGSTTILDGDIIDIAGGTGISTANSLGTITVTNTGVTSFTNTNGTFISAATQNSAATGAVTTGVIDLSATGTPSASNFLRGDNTWAVPPTTSAKLGFTPLSIYEATGKIESVSGEEGSAFSIIRQSVCETDCTIDKVDFFRLAGTDRVTIAVYTGTIASGTGNLRLLGGQTSGTTNSINTITFNTPYTFSAGDDIIILISLQFGVGNDAELLGAVNLYSNANLGKENTTYYSNPSTDFDTIAEDFSLASTKAGALHFYDE